MNLLVRPEAEADLSEAFSWYEGEREGLGHEFLARVGQQLGRVIDSPLSYPSVYRSVRRSLLPQFPFALFYLLDGETVTILCVSHQAREPDHWTERL